MTTTVKAPRPSVKTGDPTIDRILDETSHLKNYSYPSRFDRLVAHLTSEHGHDGATLTHQHALELHIAAHKPVEDAPATKVEFEYPDETVEAQSEVKTEAAPVAKTAKRDAKQDLAKRAVLALDAMVRSLDGSEACFAGMDREEMATCLSQWIHGFPTGGIWPAETLPIPNRSNWK
jgi:hypothetical protein